MAFIVAAAIRGGVKAVQSGIQAHKDFNDPAGPQPRYDSRGNPKNPGPVYGWVMKAENKLEERKNKGTAGSSAGGTVVPREEEIDAFVVEDAATSRASSEKADLKRKIDRTQGSHPGLDAPPSYQDVTKGSPLPPARQVPVAGFGGPDFPLPPQRANHDHALTRSSSSSSQSSGSSEERAQIRSRMAGNDSGLLNDLLTRKERRRALKAEYKAQKYVAEAEKLRRKAERRA